MKGHPLFWGIVMLALFILPLAGCNGEKHPVPLFQWPVSGSAPIDSLMAEFQQRHLDSGDDSVSVAIVAQMDSVASHHNLPLLARSHIDYCKANLALTMGRADRARALADNMLVMLDSSRHAYDFHAWRQIRANVYDDFMYSYRVNLDNLGYFRSIGDSLQAVKSLVLLSHMAIDIGDTVMARSYFDAIDNLLSDPRTASLKRRMAVNRALVSNDADAEKILADMRGDTAVMSSAATGIIVLQNSFLIDDSVAHLDRALLLARDTLQRFRRPILLGLKAAYYLGREPVVADSALFYARMARDLRTPDYPTPWSIEIYRFLNFSFEVCGMTDSAYQAFRQIASLEDSLEGERRTSELMRAVNNARICSLRDEKDLEKALITNRFLLVLLAVAVVAFVLIMLWHRSVARHRSAAAEAGIKLNAAMQSLKIYGMAVDENQRLVDRMKQAVAGEVRNSSPEALARSVRDIIASHSVTDEVREIMVKTQDEASREFAIRLRNDYPAITKNQVSLAQLIAAGLPNSQLAGLLNVTVDSVYKGRYRLKQLFGLGRGDSLEQFLHRYAGGTG